MQRSILTLLALAVLTIAAAPPADAADFNRDLQEKIATGEVRFVASALNAYYAVDQVERRGRRGYRFTFTIRWRDETGQVCALGRVEPPRAVTNRLGMVKLYGFDLAANGIGHCAEVPR